MWECVWVAKVKVSTPVGTILTVEVFPFPVKGVPREWKGGRMALAGLSSIRESRVSWLRYESLIIAFVIRRRSYFAHGGTISKPVQNRKSSDRHTRPNLSPLSCFVWIRYIVGIKRI